MTFDELKKIKDGAQRAVYEASDAKRASEQIGIIRRDKMPDKDGVRIPFDTGWNSSRPTLNTSAEEAIKQATLDMLPDILRLAELRLEAQHKHQSALARAKNAQVSDYLGDHHDNQD